MSKSKAKRRPTPTRAPRREKRVEGTVARKATRSREKHLSEGCGMLAAFVHNKFANYVEAAAAMEAATGFRPPKASISHWIVGKHKPNARASDALQRWAGIPIQSWYKAA